MTITFDKGLVTEKSLCVDYVSEHPISRRLNGARLVRIGDGAELPDLSAFTSDEFTSIEVTNNEGVKIPLCCTYTRIVDIIVSYSEADDTCNINIMVE